MLIHCTTNTYSELLWAFALSSEKEGAKIVHLLEMVTVLEMP